MSASKRPTKKAAARKVAKKAAKKAPRAAAKKAARKVAKKAAKKAPRAAAKKAAGKVAKKAAKKAPRAAAKKAAKKAAGKVAKKAAKKAVKAPAINSRARAALAESLEPGVLGGMGLPEGMTFANRRGRLHPAVARETVSRISQLVTLQRTIIMLSVEWNVNRNRIQPTSPLIDPPLNGNADALGALETPIESRYFVDVNARVRQSDLRALAGSSPRRTVSDLSRLIWAGIPTAHRAP